MTLVPLKSSAAIRRRPGFAEFTMPRALRLRLRLDCTPLFGVSLSTSFPCNFLRNVPARQFHAEQPLDAADFGSLAFGAKCRRCAANACAAGSTDTMNEIFGS